MNPFKTIGPAFRRLGVILLITLLVFLCLSLYYFKYIPANRERVEHLGFLRLKQHSNGINYTLSDLRETFCQRRNKFYKEQGNSAYGLRITERSFAYTVESKKPAGKDHKPTEDCQAVMHFDTDNRNELSFSFAGQFDTLVYSLPLANVFDRSLQSGAPDFFHSYLVLCQHENPHILYSSPDLPVIQSLQDDTLSKTLKKIQFSKIVPLDIGGNRHKAFLQPVTVENRSLLLVGLLQEREYNKRMQNIPFNTVSMVIILFVLILIVLPYIKIFMISSSEHMGIRDIAFAGSSMLIGTAVLLAIFHHLLMQMGAMVRTKEELYNLGQTINNGIHKEINKAYKELQYFDKSLANKVSKKDTTTLNGLK
jgi:hypothetical protein